MNAADVMTRQVITVAPDASTLQAVQLMLQNRISGLPVVDVHGRLVGMITEGDFLHRTEIGTERHRPSGLQILTSEATLADEYVHSHGRKIEEVMTCNPHTVSEETPLEKVVRIMERKNVMRVPVLREGKLVGIVTRANLLHVLARLADTSQPVGGGDATIRDRILSELVKLPWRATVSINVRDGVVELSGTILSEGEREALKVAVENVPGVKAVHDHVVWVEPNSGMVFASPEDEKAEARRCEA
jgi:CBS domain-containing protein